VIKSAAVVKAAEFKMCGLWSVALDVIVRLETVHTTTTLKLYV